MALTTKGKKTAGAGLSKTIAPGIRVCKINNISYSVRSRDGKPDDYFIMLALETEPIEGLEGFLIDKNDPSKGRHQGQVSSVKNNMFSLKDRDIKGVPKKKEDEALDFLIDLANAFDKETRNLLDGIEADNLEDFINKAQPILCNGKYLTFVIGGREYESGGYQRWSLHLVPANKGKKPFGTNAADLVPFDETNERHLKLSKPKAKEVSEFAPEEVNINTHDELAID